MLRKLKIRKLTSTGVSHIIVPLALIVIAGIVGSALMVESHADTPSPNTTPVLFIHGYINSTCPGTKQLAGTSNFGDSVTILHARGWTGKADYVGYYGCNDKSTTDSAWLHGRNQCASYFPGNTYTNGGATDSTDIRHIACQFAWYIYDDYGTAPVDVVAHSMGGIITRWALYQTSYHNAAFPPAIHLQDVVSFSTPFGGSAQLSNGAFCSGNQCKQMLPNSTLLSELHSFNAGTGTVDWTAIGGGQCDIMTPEQATWLDAANKWSYPYAKGKGKPAAPVCYNHTAYLTDMSTATNMPTEFMEPGDTDWKTTVGDHSLEHMADAILED